MHVSIGQIFGDKRYDAIAFAYSLFNLERVRGMYIIGLGLRCVHLNCPDYYDHI